MSCEFSLPLGASAHATPTQVLYHGDCPDGFAAAWLYWRTLGDRATYIPVAHGDPPPPVDGEDVLVVDFAYPRAVTLDMASRAKSLRVLDHHASAQADLAGLSFAHFDMSRSGAGLAWQDLHGDVPAPLLVQCVEDRDLHRWSVPCSQDILHLLDTIPRDFVSWDVFFDRVQRDPGSVRREGALMRRRFEASAARLVPHALPIRAFGFRGLAANAPPEFADYVAGALAASADFGLTWFLDARGLVCASWRSKQVNVIPLAQQFGGGGHPNAAGARLDLSQLTDLLGVGHFANIATRSAAVQRTAPVPPLAREDLLPAARPHKF